MKYFKAESGPVVIREDYSKQVIFNPTDLPGKGHLLQTVTIPPKTKQRVHYHEIQTEVFFILEGESLIYLNNQEYQARPGDAFVCSPGDTHYLWNTTDREFKLAVFKINVPETDDTHWDKA